MEQPTRSRGSTERLLRANAAYAEAVGRCRLPPHPATGVAVVTCMDARLDPARALGLDPGDAHVIRNAGGVVSDDVIRSLVVSQRLLGTTEVVVIAHTECAMLTFTEDGMKAQIERDTGIRPPFALEAFADLDTEVRQSIARITASPFVPHRDRVSGFVYEVGIGRLREVR